MRTPTNYKAQRNRDPYCGHRWVMHNEKGCQVKTADPEDRLLEKECKCGHLRD